jgi:hypothetical protein
MGAKAGYLSPGPNSYKIKSEFEKASEEKKG